MARKLQQQKRKPKKKEALWIKQQKDKRHNQ
jgi:hypothetical protein